MSEAASAGAGRAGGSPFLGGLPEKPRAKGPWFPPRTVRGTQLLLLLVVLAPLLLVQAGIYSGWVATRRSAELQANLELARSVAGTLDAFVDDVLRHELDVSLAFTSTPPLPAEYLDRLLVESAREFPSVEDFAWVNPQGIIVASSSPTMNGVSVSDRTYFQQIIGGREGAVSDLLQGRQTGRPVFVIARGIRDQGGALLGVVIGVAGDSGLGEVLRFERTGGGSISISDPRGYLVYRYPEAQLAWEQRDWLAAQPSAVRAVQERAFAGEEVSGIFISAIDGKERISALAPVGSIGWVTAASRPVDEIMAPIVRDLLRDGGLFLLVAVMAVLSAVAVTRSITVPLRRLARSALALGSGQRGLRMEVDGPAELRDLAAAFNEMSAELADKEEQRERLVAELKEVNRRLVSASLQNRDLAGALETERDLLQTAMENTHACLAYLDPQFNFVMVNSTYARESGHSREELIGRNHFDLFPNEENLAIFRRVRDEGAPVQFRAKPFEYADQPWRGVTYWDWTLVPVRDEAGQVRGLVFSLLDVTESVRARQRIEELARQHAEARNEAERRAGELDAAFAAISDPVVVYDASGTVAQADPAAVAAFGFDPVGMDLETLIQRLRMRYSDGRIATAGNAPSSRALRGQPVVGERMVFVDVGGHDVMVLVSVSPLRREGQVQGAVSVWHDVTAREHAYAEQQLLAADNARLYREAREAVNLRDEFLSVAAHELKTPITSLRGFAQLTVRQIDREGAVDPDRARRALQVIDQQSDKLAKLVSQLLDVTRLEAGRLVLDRRAVDVASLVRDQLAAVQLDPSLHQLLLESPATVWALADPLRLEQVVTNLIDNAARYSPRGGEIQVQVWKPDPATVSISVRDHGIGIPPEHREKIFDRFYQAHAGRNYGGMGLGLYISRHIVELHGGRIQVDSPAGEGTRFRVSFPTGLDGDPRWEEDKW